MCLKLEPNKVEISNIEFTIFLQFQHPCPEMRKYHDAIRNGLNFFSGEEYTYLQNSKSETCQCDTDSKQNEVHRCLSFLNLPTCLYRDAFKEKQLQIQR